MTLHPSQFFQALYRGVPPEYFAEIRMIAENGDKKPTRLYRPASHIHEGDFNVLAEMNSDYHIYHRIALSLEKRSRKQDIGMITALWLDIDTKSDELITQIADYVYPPTMLVDSGAGLHCYWLLKEPLVLDSDKARYEAERTMQGIILDTGGASDPKAKDITRILRTPAFVNIKAKYAPNYPTCRVLWYDPSQGDRYHFKHLHRRFAPLGAPESPVIRRALPVINDGSRPKWIVDYLATGTGEGSRNQRLFVVARWFNDIGDKSAQAEQELIARAMADGLSQSEANATIRSAWTQAANPSANVPRHMKRIMGIEDTE